MKKNLVLGTIKGYDFEVLRPFLATLKKAGYEGDTVFFYSQIDPKTLETLREWGVILVPFMTTPPYMEGAWARHNEWTTNAHWQNTAVHSLRYLLAYCYLKEFGDRYENVLLSDTRDVIFQKDPFDFSPQDKLYCFTEHEGSVIADSSINAMWIEKGFGKEVSDELASKPIICSGVTVGSAARVLEYLSIFVKTVVDRDVPIEIPGMDQGIHNYLIYKNLLPALQIYKNDEGPVFTVGIEDTLVRKNGHILNGHVVVPNVVHQYDRHWNVAKHYYSVRFIIRHHIAYTRGHLSTFFRSRLPGIYGSFISVRNAILRRNKA